MRKIHTPSPQWPRRTVGLAILCLAMVALLGVLGIGVRGLVAAHPTLAEDLRANTAPMPRIMP